MICGISETAFSLKSDLEYSSENEFHRHGLSSSISINDSTSLCFHFFIAFITLTLFDCFLFFLFLPSSAQRPPSSEIIKSELRYFSFPCSFSKFAAKRWALPSLYALYSSVSSRKSFSMFSKINKPREKNIYEQLRKGSIALELLFKF